MGKSQHSPAIYISMFQKLPLDSPRMALWWTQEHNCTFILMHIAYCAWNFAINPAGLTIFLNLSKMALSISGFIECLNWVQIKHKIQRISSKLQIDSCAWIKLCTEFKDCVAKQNDPIRVRFTVCPLEHFAPLNNTCR